MSFWSRIFLFVYVATFHASDLFSPCLANGSLTKQTSVVAVSNFPISRDFTCLARAFLNGMHFVVYIVASCFAQTFRVCKYQILRAFRSAFIVFSALCP